MARVDFAFHNGGRHGIRHSMSFKRLLRVADDANLPRRTLTAGHD